MDIRTHLHLPLIANIYEIIPTHKLSVFICSQIFSKSNYPYFPGSQKIFLGSPMLGSMYVLSKSYDLGNILEAMYKNRPRYVQVAKHQVVVSID